MICYKCGDGIESKKVLFQLNPREYLIENGYVHIAPI